MNAKKMFLSLIPWALFSVMIERRGANAAGFAALAAAAVALWFALKDRESGGFKVIDLAGIATFGVLAVSCFVGGDSVRNWVADYGRGTAAGVLALVMLGSAVTVPFTEQYARESVPREYWHSPVFRAVNRRISAVWGAVVAVMALGHLLAGAIDPATAPKSGTASGRPAAELGGPDRADPLCDLLHEAGCRWSRPGRSSAWRQPGRPQYLPPLTHIRWDADPMVTNQIPQPIDQSKEPHLQGAVRSPGGEVDVADLKVEGELPPELDGDYIRNGPNPRFPPLGGYLYPLDGDGMLHRVRSATAPPATRTVSCVRPP